jgi:hypothetical protein
MLSWILHPWPHFHTTSPVMEAEQVFPALDQTPRIPRHWWVMRHMALAGNGIPDDRSSLTEHPLTLSPA